MKKILLYILFIACIFCSCNDTLDIQQIYSFELRTMPVPKRIMRDETVEIRCQIVKEGYFSGTQYFIRYFQPDGRGELHLDDGRYLLPNDLYLLKNDTFRLYYTSRSADAQTIDIYIEDTFGQVIKKTLSFSNENSSDNK